VDPTLKKAVMAGLGIFSATKEKIESFVDEMVQRGEMEQGEKAQFVEETMEKVELRAKEAKEWVTKQAEETWEKMRPKAQQQIDELQEKLAGLSRELEELKAKMNPKE
jgi:polyhydroxyalkanoate synthesis regulator phasin